MRGRTRTKEHAAELPLRCGGDADWGVGYESFPCIIVELEHGIYSVSALGPGEHPELLFAIAEAQAKATKLPVRLSSGMTGIDYRDKSGPSIQFESLSEIGLSRVGGDWIVPYGLPLPCEMPVPPYQREELARLVTERSKSLPTPDLPYRSIWERFATQNEIDTIGDLAENGHPRGCRRCRRCHELHGLYVKVEKPNFMNKGKCLALRVYCRCENDNLCARCGQPLAERKLRRNYFDETTMKLAYMPGTRALEHTCQDKRQQRRGRQGRAQDAPPAETW